MAEQDRRTFDEREVVADFTLTRCSCAYRRVVRRRPAAQVVYQNQPVPEQQPVQIGGFADEIKDVIRGVVILVVVIFFLVQRYAVPKRALTVGFEERE